MRRLFANANFDFLGRRRLAYMISGIAIAISIAAAAFNAVATGSWANYGVDFSGGSRVLVKILSDPEPSESQIRDIVLGVATGSQVGSFGGRGEFQIRTPGSDAGTGSGPADAVVAALQSQFGEANVDVESKEAVSAKVGGELQTRALLAILISFGATLIYLAFRFEWRFGAAAVIATAHDIVITLGLLSLLRMEISLQTVAAVLTIVGYSLNDKIIVFDRIRENLKATRRPDFIATLNRSINDTLPRTVMTSVTTLVTLLSLYLFGGAIIRDFAFILIIGIVLGTYSSIMIGAPTLLELEKRFPHEQKTVKRARVAKPSRV
jgi:preprotein translocase subunit SecF